MPKRQNAKDSNEPASLPLPFFACPNGDCADFSRFDSCNLSVAEWMDKDKAIRRLYCKTCGEASEGVQEDTECDHSKIPFCRLGAGGGFMAFAGKDSGLMEVAQRFSAARG